MTIDEIKEQFVHIQFNAIGKVDMLTEEVQKLREEMRGLKSRVFKLENKDVGE